MTVKELVKVYNKYYWICINGLICEDKTVVPPELLGKEVESAEFYEDNGYGKGLFIYVKEDKGGGA